MTESKLDINFSESPLVRCDYGSFKYWSCNTHQVVLQKELQETFFLAEKSNGCFFKENILIGICPVVKTFCTPKKKRMQNVLLNAHTVIRKFSGDFLKQFSGDFMQTFYLA